MNATTAAILSVIIVSLFSLSGLIILAFRERTVKKIILELVAFSIGSLLGSVFLHILPEVAEELGFSSTIGLLLLAGFLLGFILEKFVHWHHCHGHHCDHSTAAGRKHHDKHVAMHTQPFALLNVLGDAVHNFLDGVLIAAAYLTNVSVGVATTVAVLFHEIPQEIGDFAVLIHAGWSRWKALLMNFVSALFALLGAGITLFLGTVFVEVVPYILPVAAGLFLYLAASDLVPELQKETRAKRSVMQLIAVLAGVGIMLLLSF